jgi:GTP-binding protein HflX
VRQDTTVLTQLAADRVPQNRVYNKIDKRGRQPRFTKNQNGAGRAVWLSAVSGEGIPLLLQSIAARLPKRKLRGVIRLLPGQGRQRALLFAMDAVLREQAADDGGWIMELELAERDFNRFLKREKLPIGILEKSQDAETADIALLR